MASGEFSCLRRVTCNGVLNAYVLFFCPTARRFRTKWLLKWLLFITITIIITITVYFYAVRCEKATCDFHYISFPIFLLSLRAGHSFSIRIHIYGSILSSCLVFHLSYTSLWPLPTSSFHMYTLQQSPSLLQAIQQ